MVLLHRYSFNDGTAGDSVGGAAWAGTLVGSVTVVNQKAVLASNGQYVSLPSGLFGSYSSVSVEVWISTGANSLNARVFEWGHYFAGGAQKKILSVLRDGSKYPATVYVTWWDTSVGLYPYTESSISFDNQASLHIVLTVTGGTLARLYINGALAATLDAGYFPQPSFPRADTFGIGKGFDSISVTPTLIGSVDEVRVWGGVLSAAEVSTRYSQGSGQWLSCSG